MNNVFRTVCAAASLCAALVAAGAGINATDGRALELNGAFATHLLGAKGGYPKLSKSALDGYRLESSVLDVAFSNRVSSALAGWLVAGPSAPPPGVTVAVLRVLGGKEVDRLVLANAELAELKVVNLGAQPRPVEFHVKVLSRSASVIGGTASASIPVAQPEPYTVRLIVDGKPVSPIVVTGLGAQGSQDAATAVAKGKTGNCNDFAATFHHTDIGWLYDWYNTTVTSVAKRSPPPTRRVDIELVGAKPVRLASLTGVIIRSFDPFADPAGLAVMSDFECTQFSLLADAFK